MSKIKVLFVCIHNSARSQMAEAFLNKLGGLEYEAESGGLEPGKLNPSVVESMKEIGIDISGNKTKRALDLLNQGRRYDFVVTVCDETSAERCPVFPGTGKRLHWGFEDPSGFQGTAQEKMTRVGVVRDLIKAKIEEFIQKNAESLGTRQK